MSKDFEDILTSLLDEYQECGDVNTVIGNSCKKFAVSQETFDKIQRVNALLDAFAEKAESLQQAKEQGKSRRQWMKAELDAITEGRTEEDKTNLLNGIYEAGETVLNNALTME
ncbi:MAG: hypothetical protein J6V04_04550 [Bacteroidales bacterium]|nr:hypothetical protein [Bacteroidales bacterium]